jgi:chromosome segregation ATPase
METELAVQQLAVMEALLVSLGQQDGNARSIVNGILEIVAKCNALLENGKITAAQLAGVTAQLASVVSTVDRLARASETLAGELQQVREAIAAALPEIYTRLKGLEDQEAAQGRRLDSLEAQGREQHAALRDVAQIVVGQGEGQAEALARVRDLAQEARDAGREATGAVKTLAAGGEETKRSGAAAALHAIAYPIKAFGGLPLASQIVLAFIILGLAGLAAAFKKGWL